MIYWNKQPSEKLPKTIDFTDALPTGETLTSATVTATDSAAVDVSTKLIGGVVVVTPNVRINLLADVAASAGPPPVVPLGEGLFRIRFRAVTTPGAYILEEDVELTILEE